MCSFVFPVFEGQNASEQLREKAGEFGPDEAGGESPHSQDRADCSQAQRLVVEFFPNGGASSMDAARLKLAAQHYVDAETCRDPVIRQRATRCAEYLLAKVERQEEPLMTARELLEQLGKDDSFG